MLLRLENGTRKSETGFQVNLPEKIYPRAGIILNSGRRIVLIFLLLMVFRNSKRIKLRYMKIMKPVNKKWKILQQLVGFKLEKILSSKFLKKT